MSESQPPRETKTEAGAPPAAAGDDLLSRLAWRLSRPPDVIPRLGLRFAPTPDLPDEETARWRDEWRVEADE